MKTFCPGVLWHPNSQPAVPPGTLQTSPSVPAQSPLEFCSEHNGIQKFEMSEKHNCGTLVHDYSSNSSSEDSENNSNSSSSDSSDCDSDTDSDTDTDTEQRLKEIVIKNLEKNKCKSRPKKSRGQSEEQKLEAQRPRKLYPEDLRYKLIHRRNQIETEESKDQIEKK